MIVVIKNETHQLFDEHLLLIEQLATNADVDIKVLEVPADGWDFQERD